MYVSSAACIDAAYEQGRMSPHEFCSPPSTVFKSNPDPGTAIFVHSWNFLSLLSAFETTEYLITLLMGSHSHCNLLPIQSLCRPRSVAYKENGSHR
jgi:hypothetical protein